MKNLTFTDGRTMQVGTMYCIGRNYLKHAIEMGEEIPKEPLIFIKPPAAFISDGGTVKLPSISNNIGYELELVAIVGKDVPTVTPREAVNYIAGYAVGIDVTLRDIQQKSMEAGTPWAIAKGFATSAPISEIIPIENVQSANFDIELKLNGETRQKVNTSEMAMTAADIISYLSNIFHLTAGDCIFTGTPAGVGQIKHGDKLQAELIGYTKIEVDVADWE